MRRIFAIGDIHGCYDKLRALLDQLPIDWSRDRLVFMGDYIDRGPQSFEVVEHLVELQARHPGIVFLKGNHEQMLADYLSGRDRMTYLYNGGQQTLDSYLRQASASGRYPIPDAHLRFFESLRAVITRPKTTFSCTPACARACHWTGKSVEDLLWIREKFIDSSPPVRETGGLRPHAV
ncbi:MAG: serine/threonine protein phosphatase [Desulfobacterales bacterium]|nr:serine/threonine protein phosphatase [Desulfobacterales bacterium]